MTAQRYIRISMETPGHDYYKGSHGAVHADSVEVASAGFGVLIFARNWRGQLTRTLLRLEQDEMTALCQRWLEEVAKPEKACETCGTHYLPEQLNTKGLCTMCEWRAQHGNQS